MKAECGKSALAGTTEYVALPFRYINVKLIGHGATSVVLRAHDSFLDKDVAIKYMKSELSDNTSVRRFQQEAKMMSSFNIMHLPMVLDFGLTNCGRPFMVMELVEGKSLKEIIRDRGPLPVDLAIEIMLQLLTAITHAHERGIVHRDLKSQNVMITWTEDKQPLVKLIDFGLAKSTIDNGFITSIGVAVGTPLYMSPEQACGNKTDERSDIYSLGCVFFEMLTGFTPFQRETTTRTINAHISEPAPRLRSLRSFSTPLFSQLECITKKMLEKNPNNRYKNARSIAEELESLFPSCVESTDQCTDQYTAVKVPTMVASAAREPRAKSPQLRPLTILILSLVTIILLSTTICSALDACEPQSTNSVPTQHQDGYNLAPRPHRDKFHIANKTAYALPTANDKDLHVLNNFKEINHVHLVATEITGEGINEISNLNIESLDLDALTIDQSGFDAIGKMQKLAALRLDYQKYLSGSKLATLKNCKQLATLSVSNTYLSQQSQQEISALAQLTELNLDGVIGLTDETLRLFQGSLPRLQSLSMRAGGRFSNNAIEQFKAARPDVTVRI